MKPHVQLLLLLALTAALLFPGAEAQYVWDDQALILRNPHLLEPSLGWLLGGDLWAGIGESEAHFYRPLMLASLLVDQGLGLGPRGAQLHSLGWHLVSVGLLFGLLRRHGAGSGALLGATLLALHPAQSAVVRFVAARNDPMALSFALLALLLLTWKGWRAAVVAGVAMFAALLSKETAAVAVVGAALLVPRSEGKRLGPFFGAFLVYWILREQAALDGPRMDDAGRLLSAGAQALECLVWTPACSPMMAPSELHGVAWGGLVLLPLIALGCWRGGRLAWAGAAWFLLAGALGVGGAVLADGLGWRYADLPLAGLAMVLAAQPWPDDKRSLAAGIGLAALLVFPLRLALPQWETTTALWERAHAVQPGPATACGLFKAYELGGLDEEAAALLPEALPRPHCCFNASRFDLDRGRPEQAIALGELALERGCAPSPELIAPMALSSALLGDWDAAERRIAPIQGDPYGYTPVLRSAAALRRGDRSVLERYLAEPAPEGAPPLEGQVEWLLHQSSTPSP